MDVVVEKAGKAKKFKAPKTVKPTQEELALEKAKMKVAKTAATKLNEQRRKDERNTVNKIKRDQAKFDQKEEADRVKKERDAAVAEAVAALAATTMASKKAKAGAKARSSADAPPLTKDERAELTRYRLLGAQMQTCHDAGGPVTISKDRQDGLKVKLAIPITSSPSKAGLKGGSPGLPVSQKSVSKSAKVKITSVTPHGKVCVSNSAGKPVERKVGVIDGEELVVGRHRSRNEDWHHGGSRGRSRDRIERLNERSRDAHVIQHSECSGSGRGRDRRSSNDSREERHERGSRERQHKRSRDHRGRESRSSHDRDRRDRSRSRDHRGRESRSSHDLDRRDRSRSRDHRGRESSSSNSRDCRSHDRSSNRDSRRHGR